jgi:hypothetical protein
MSKKIDKNRECPGCHNDCGYKAEFYPFSVCQFTECKNCGARIVNDFQYPDFFWGLCNWKVKQYKDGSIGIKGI